MHIGERRASQLIKRLAEIRNLYESGIRDEKIELLRALRGIMPKTASQLQLLHSTVSFLRAFPDTLEHHRLACEMLEVFEDWVAALPDDQKAKLDDSGISGSKIYYPFSFEVGTWLWKRFPGSVQIGWDSITDTGRLDELLSLIIPASEIDFFNSGYVTTAEWIALAKQTELSDFDWLFAQLKQNKNKQSIWANLYNASDIYLTWDLTHSSASKSHNVFAVDTIFPRREGMRKVSVNPKREVSEPISSIRRLSRKNGKALINVGMAALAARHRETYHFNHANPNEVYLADVGEGVAVGITGLLPEYRFNLETTVGYLILSNGAPIGYGGGSVLFYQVNTGINLFDEYRGSEAAFLWVSVMRTFHHLFGCKRFVINPYQIGNGNPEALKSGAFWFYYRLGYRPTTKAIHTLAVKEWNKIKREHKYRTPIVVLKRLVECDMHLTLTGAKVSEFFQEPWIDFCAAAATESLSRQKAVSRKKAIKHVICQVASKIGAKKLKQWRKSELRALRQLGPIINELNLDDWTQKEKRSLLKIIRKKSGCREIDYGRSVIKHRRFREALVQYCRKKQNNYV